MGGQGSASDRLIVVEMSATHRPTDRARSAMPSSVRCATAQIVSSSTGAMTRLGSTSRLARFEWRREGAGVCGRRLRSAGERSRRRVVASILVAGALAGIGVTSASAAVPSAGTTTCNGQALSAPEALLACLLSLAYSSDFQPKDMKVAAPSSVISSTITSTPNTSAPESPTKRVAEVNRWRPNTQAWKDAMTRVSGATGLTSRDVAQTARWQPKLTPGTVPVGKMGTSLLRGGAENRRLLF